MPVKQIAKRQKFRRYVLPELCGGPAYAVLLRQFLVIPDQPVDGERLILGDSVIPKPEVDEELAWRHGHHHADCCISEVFKNPRRWPGGTQVDMGEVAGPHPVGQIDDVGEVAGVFGLQRFLVELGHPARKPSDLVDDAGLASLLRQYLLLRRHLGQPHRTWEWTIGPRSHESARISAHQATTAVRSSLNWLSS
jgi:hypothetical protein